jgi:hypothetical protein
MSFDREQRCLTILKAASQNVTSSASWHMSDEEVFLAIQKLPDRDREIIRDAIRASLAAEWKAG